jgi:hypothetical protein
MDEQTQPQPQVQPQPVAGQPATPAKKTNIWVWILGGCLVIILLIGVTMAGLAWWGARKVKNVIKESQPKLEEMQKGAADMQKAAEEWQKEMEKIKDQMPAAE